MPADAVSGPPRPLWRSGASAKAFVDLQNDVTADDVALAARENYRSVEHLKVLFWACYWHDSPK
jgi:sarcosine oxidase subunit alpha